jgi:hypothetical protein
MQGPRDKWRDRQYAGQVPETLMIMAAPNAEARTSASNIPARLLIGSLHLPDTNTLLMTTALSRTHGSGSPVQEVRFGTDTNPSGCQINT